MATPETETYHVHMDKGPDEHVQSVGHGALSALVVDASREVKYGFEDAEHAMGSLVSQLPPEIKSGRWSSVLGDDESGRLPALVVGGVMKEWSSQQGTRKPKQLFVAGGRVRESDVPAGSSLSEITEAKAAALSKYIKQIKSELGERTLVVTEYVRANGIVMLAEALHGNGVSFDLAVVESRKTEAEHVRDWEEASPRAFEKANVYIGQEHMHYPVFKDGDPLRRGKGVVRSTVVPVAAATGTDREYVNASRQEANKMAHDLYEQYLG